MVLLRTICTSDKLLTVQFYILEDISHKMAAKPVSILVVVKPD